MTPENNPIVGVGESFRALSLPITRRVLSNRRASLFGPWNWLDQLRFRFDLAIEVLDPDLSYVLSSAPGVGRAPDIRAALLDQRDQLRLTATSVMRLAKARSFAAGGLRIRIFPLLAGLTMPRQPVGLLLLGDAGGADSQSEDAEEIDRRLDAAGQWLTAAIEGMIDATGSRIGDTPSPNRLHALIDVVETFHHVEDARQLIELTVEAIALWFDADVRAYRQDLSGSFILETWLPGIDASRVPRQLSGNDMWGRDEVFRLESVRDLENVGWDARSAETLFVPITIGDTVRWLITVSAGTESGIEDMLEFFRRFDSLLLSSLEREAEDALRRRVVDRLCLDDAPFEATLQLGLEASALGVQASAGRLEVFYAVSRVAALSSTWGSFALDGDVSAHETAEAHQMTLRAAIGANVMAVFTFQKQMGVFSSDDVHLARSAVTVFANWLSGTFRSHTGERSADVSIPRDFGERLRRDVDRVRRENRGGALAVMRPRATVPLGAELDDVARVLEDHVRDSDTVGIISDAAAALLPALPEQMTSAVTDRLLRAAARQAHRCTSRRSFVAAFIRVSRSACSSGSVEHAEQARVVLILIMVARSRLGDRRESARFDVAGQLWAALDLTAQVVLRNIGIGGALVEATLAPGLRSIRAAQMSLLTQGAVLNVVVRHMSPVSSTAEENRYLVGLEFIHITAAARSEVERLVREWNGLE